MDFETDLHLRSEANKAITCLNEGEYEEAVAIAADLLIGKLENSEGSEAELDIAKALHHVVQQSTFDYRARVAAARYVGNCKKIAAIDYDGNLSECLHISRERARLSAFVPPEDRGDIARKILIACPMKTASTFVYDTLEKLTGYQTRMLSYSYGSLDHHPYIPFLINNRKTKMLAKEHYKAKEGVIQLLQAFDFKVIVLVRNIFDALVSQRDMLVSGFGSYAGEFGEHLSEMPPEEQLEAVVARFALWYVEFYATWARCYDRGQLPCLFTSFEQIIDDKVTMFRKLAEFSTGMQISEENTRQFIDDIEKDKAKIRLNKGKKDRGAKLFPDHLIDQVHSYTRFYPDVDFSLIGLDRA